MLTIRLVRSRLRIIGGAISFDIFGSAALPGRKAAFSNLALLGINVLQVMFMSQTKVSGKARRSFSPSGRDRAAGHPPLDVNRP